MNEVSIQKQIQHSLEEIEKLHKSREEEVYRSHKTDLAILSIKKDLEAIKVRQDKMIDNLQKILWIIGGGFIMAAVGWVVGGGFIGK